MRITREIRIVEKNFEKSKNCVFDWFLILSRILDETI